MYDGSNAEEILRERLAYMPGGKITPDNTGEFLLHQVKRSTVVRRAVVKALLVPNWRAPYTPPLRPTNSEIVAAMRIIAFGLNRCPDDYRRAWLGLSGFLINKQTPSPRFAESDLRRARPLLRFAAQHVGFEFSVLENRLCDYPNIIRAGDCQQHRGGSFSDYHKRMLTAVILLHECGESKDHAREQVSGLLREQGTHLQATGLRSIEHRYRRACTKTKDLTQIDHLSRYYLYRLGHLLMLGDLLTYPGPLKTRPWTNELLRKLRVIRSLISEIPRCVFRPAAKFGRRKFPSASA